MTEQPQDPNAVATTDPLKELLWAEPAAGLLPTVSLEDLLTGLQLLATPAARQQASTSTGWSAKTPASMQVIKSGALSITTWWTKWIAGVGGVTGLLGTIAGAVAAFKSKVGEPVTVALIAGGFAFLSASAIAIALFVKGDLEARGRATAARHAGRAEVAAMFLRATALLPVQPAQAAGGQNPATAEASGNSAAPSDGGGNPPPSAAGADAPLAAAILQAAAAFPGKVLLTKKNGQVAPLTGVDSRDGPVKFGFGGTDLVKADELSSFNTRP